MVDSKPNIIKYKNYNYSIIRAYPKSILSLNKLLHNDSTIKNSKDLCFHYKLSVENNILFLKELELISNSFIPPVVNGIEAITHKRDNTNVYTYKKLHCPLTYTGNIIISRKYTYDRANTDNNISDYNINIQLYFNTGNLTSALTVKEDIWNNDLDQPHEDFCKYLKKQFLNKKAGVTK